MNNVLLTGFRGNSSERLVNCFGSAYQRLILGNNRDKNAVLLEKAISGNRYDYIFSFGQKPVIRDKIYIELMGKMNGISYKTNLDADRFSDVLKGSGFSVRFSENAGTSFCNHIYFHGLKYISDNSCKTKMLFVHIPLEKNIPDFDDFSGRLACALESFLTDGRMG